jgi:hypothetical protein
VEDIAKILDACAGSDPKNELMSFSTGRTPVEGYTAASRNGYPPRPKRQKPDRRQVSLVCPRSDRRARSRTRRSRSRD